MVMIDKKTKLDSYFDLAEHNPVQQAIFYTLTVLGIILVFFLILTPLMGYIFKVYLDGTVYNDSFIKLSDTIDSKKERMTHSLFLWAIDIYKNTPQESRYWFEPITSLAVPSTIFGLIFSIVITSLLPSKIGFMRRKIEREIANYVSMIAFMHYDVITDESPDEIEQMILSSDIREMYGLSEKWGLGFDELKALKKAIIWRDANILKQILSINDGITMYMRFYFTVKYSNAVLGFVYMGAAVLIIIIGLRGLKFIPPTQPSLIFFSLGLEFSLLIVYAFTLMYGKQEEDAAPQNAGKSITAAHVSMMSQPKKANSKEIENLLRAFIKSNNR